MTDSEVARLIACRAHMSYDCFVGQGALHAEIPPLCRGSPLAAFLLGGLMASPTFDLMRYLNQHEIRDAKGLLILDWTKVQYTTFYEYASFEQVNFLFHCVSTIEISLPLFIPASSSITDILFHLCILLIAYIFF